MKTNKIIKSIQLVAVLGLLVCLAFALGINSSASGDTALAVGDTNLEYNKNTHIIVTLDGEAPAGSTKGIAVWNYNVSGELTLENASYLNFEEEDAYGVKYFATEGIPASELSEELTIAPVLKDGEGNVTIAGELVKRSAFGYVEERLGDNGLMGYQIDLYRDLVVYGTASEQVLGDGVAGPASGGPAQDIIRRSQDRGFCIP